MSQNINLLNEVNSLGPLLPDDQPDSVQNQVKPQVSLPEELRNAKPEERSAKQVFADPGEGINNLSNSLKPKSQPVAQEVPAKVPAAQSGIPNTQPSADRVNTALVNQLLDDNMHGAYAEAVNKALVEVKANHPQFTAISLGEGAKASVVNAVLNAQEAVSPEKLQVMLKEALLTDAKTQVLSSKLAHSWRDMGLGEKSSSFFTDMAKDILARAADSAGDAHALFMKAGNEADVNAAITKMQKHFEYVIGEAIEKNARSGGETQPKADVNETLVSALVDNKMSDIPDFTQTLNTVINEAKKSFPQYTAKELGQAGRENLLNSVLNAQEAVTPEKLQVMLKVAVLTDAKTEVLSSKLAHSWGEMGFEEKSASFFTDMAKDILARAADSAGDAHALFTKASNEAEVNAAITKMQAHIEYVIGEAIDKKA
ncbi:MAG: hypothetical protein IJU76_10595 [Desulfovibrionaceae bacterium]|nr:hypothetical protein [Desulfovibrionaceae bacterium]